MKKKFWFVWNPSAHIPRYQHDTAQSAKAEAERLAIKCPGMPFFVLESVGYAKKVETIWINLPKSEPIESDEIPF